MAFLQMVRSKPNTDIVDRSHGGESETNLAPGTEAFYEHECGKLPDDFRNGPQEEYSCMTNRCLTPLEEYKLTEAILESFTARPGSWSFDDSWARDRASNIHIRTDVGVSGVVVQHESIGNYNSLVLRDKSATKIYDGLHTLRHKVLSATAAELIAAITKANEETKQDTAPAPTPEEVLTPIYPAIEWAKTVFHEPDTLQSLGLSTAAYSPPKLRTVNRLTGEVKHLTCDEEKQLASA